MVSHDNETSALGTRRQLAIVGLFCLLCVLSGALAHAQIGGAAKDPAKVAGPEACGECHVSELNAWKQTHHATTFVEMHRRDEAKTIVTAMGGRRIKQDETCVQCHYTEGLRNDRPRSMWGITCESCHAQAKDWVEVHNDFGGKDVTRETETPEHRKERLAKTDAAGMIRPAMTYEAAANCFQCHTVPDEQLVNVGGHKVRSEFELVAWSQGEVRHNHYYSEDKKNRLPSDAHRRVLYVTGRALDLEYSLRAAAKATGPGAFFDTAKGAVAAATQSLQAVQTAQAIAEVEQMLAAVASLEVEVGQAAALTEAAEAVSKSAKAFVSGNDGSGLAALDVLLPDPESYRGNAQP